MSDTIVYGLRTCKADMTSRGGFVWPREGWVEAPDWDPSPEYGGGLHFLRNGEGDISLLSRVPDAAWLVVMSYASETVDIDGGVSKARRCKVLYAGSRAEAVVKLRALVGPDKRIPYINETAGFGAIQTAGFGAIQTATARSTQVAGSYSTQTAWSYSTQTAWSYSTQTAGARSTQTAGSYSTQTAGFGATQTAGFGATQVAGFGATQVAGFGATQTAGDNSTQTAGEGSVMVNRWWDNERQCYRVATAIVGKDGTLKPDTPYRVVQGVWTEVTPQPADTVRANA